MDTTICLCKHISEETVRKAIENGANTLEKVKAATGAACGACKGARCVAKIEALLNEYR